ncbi:SDR family oxidoreductase [Quadrisphaera sp. DSM 44207]|uniref:SDR family NAD(P)-dependent oxidoreductase n=1 Tax=Quadrisphaera sp. DSM 44207 TaxID=1881057 RepID=UPI0008810CF1|nr:SDR family NAD(P)-dependent oxidoreductase [Quadrisphaera sp. DSM 44207]SDQ06292.1 Short-chain dehydrogenase [Quadrisphaera sp. DSM 44207]
MPLPLLTPLARLLRGTAPGPDPHGVAAGRVVWVTGASSGIGRAVALACAARGDRLVLSSRAAGVLEQVRAECEAAGAAGVLVRPLDVTDEHAVHAAADDAVQAFGRLDVVVQASGVVSYARVDEQPLDVFDRVVQVDVLGAVRVCQAALRTFRRQRSGTLVVVGSVLGKTAAPWMGAYVTSKWALRGLTRVMQVENRDLRDVHVTLVSPGGVDTPIYDQAANFVGRRPRPPFPVASPQDVAAKVLHAVERPHRELDVGWANPFVVAGFVLLPAVYDALVTPLMRVASFTPRRTGPTTGNVHAPRPELERLRQDRGRRR